jgi:hypothetical protein
MNPKCGLALAAMTILLLTIPLVHSRLPQRSHGEIRIVQAESGRNLASLFEDLHPIAHFANGTWKLRGSPTKENNTLLWRIGSFLGLVTTVHAQSPCGFTGCAGSYVRLHGRICDCNYYELYWHVDTDGIDYCDGFKATTPVCVSCASGLCDADSCYTCE